MIAHPYLMDEHPHFFYPTLADELGLNEAIIIQQIHSWIQTYLKDPDEYRAKHYHDDAWWIWDSYPDWHKKLPYLSESTIRRSIKHLRELGLLKVANYNTLKIDRTHWYTIDYEAYDRFWSDDDTKMDAPSDQNEQMEDVILDRPSVQNEQMHLTEMDRPLPDSSSFSSSFSSPDQKNGASAPAPSNPAKERLDRLRAKLGSDPFTVAANSKRAQDQAGAIWTVPVDAGGTDSAGDLMLDAWLETMKIAPDTLPEGAQGKWTKTLSKLAGTLNISPDQAAEAVEVVLDPDNPEWSWYTYSSPSVPKFTEDWTVVSLRLLNGGTGYLTTQRRPAGVRRQRPSVAVVNS